ncbi:uncharacterized protein [Diadema antillarum]|uniref:uncharacterized protein n=1 Tax=Diadema antillarum TaxID=105358 RepID=UPI003A86AE8F
MTRSQSAASSRVTNTAGTLLRGRMVAMETLFILQVLLTAASAATNVGQEFTFAFPPNYDVDMQDSNLGLIIQPAAPSRQTVVTVSVPLQNRSMTLTIDPWSSPYHLTMPADLANTMISALTHATVRVRANHDIALVAFNYKEYTMDMYTVLPTSHLGKEYFVATYTKPRSGVILISALETSVNVQVTVNYDVEFLGQRYVRGNVIEHELRPYMTMQLEPEESDIVGTRIVATSNVAVTVGCPCANIPVGFPRCDHLSEQLVPFDRWGRSFFLSPFPRRLSGYQFHVVAGRDNTVVQIDRNVTRLNTGEHYLGDERSQRMISITSNQPIMVVQYTKGTSTDDRMGDPAMVVVSPVEQYTSMVEFPVLEFHSAGIAETYVSITMDCNQTNTLRFDNLTNDQLTWLETCEIRTADDKFMCTKWMAVGGGRHALRSELPGDLTAVSGEVMFTSQVYGVGSRIAYLYNAGLGLEKLTCTTQNSTSPNQNYEVSCDQFLPTGLPLASRKCFGRQGVGAYWSEIRWEDCGTRTAPFSAEEISKVTVDDSNVEEVSDVIQEMTATMTEVDDALVSAVSKTLENIVAISSPKPKVTTSVTRAVNNLIGAIGSTNSSSESLAASSSSVVRSLEQQVSVTLRADGEFFLEESNLVVRALTLDPAARRKGVESLVNGQGDGQQSASIKLPASVFTTKGGQGNQVRFITYNGDSLFRSQTSAESSGNVISAAVEGVTVNDLAEPIEITFSAARVLQDNNTAGNQSQCVYWDFDLRNGVGDWSSEGCSLSDVNGNEVTCACNHLTNFAVLLDITGQHRGSKTSFHFALDILSKVGCAVSIVALTITILVFLVFRRLRASRPRRILLHFCISLLALYLVFLFGIDHASHRDRACLAVGALLHYFLLSTMMWMAVEALNMYLMIIRVFDEEGPCFLTKATVAAWGAPLVVVGVSVGLRMDDYLHKPYCFLTPTLTFLLGVILPIGLILVFNFIIFLVVVRRLCTSNLGGTVPSEKEDKAARYRQLRARLLNAFSISVLLGLTWVFGFLAIEDAAYIFQLLFCVINSLQGLVVFILFCVRQEDVRKSMSPHYQRLAGLLSHSGRPSTITAYSLTSRSTSRNDQEALARNPLRTAPMTPGTYTRRMMSDEAAVSFTSTSNDGVDYVY